MKETIYDPEANSWAVPAGENPAPTPHHCEIEHGPGLSSSDNRIVNNLIAQGYAVHETVSTFYLAFPRWMRSEGSCFVGCVRNEFQVKLGEVGFLRFRFEVPGEVYLTLFYIRPEHQNQGHARKWFPRITNDLLRAGAESLRGRVMPSMYPAKRTMDYQKLSEFYRREAGFEILGGNWIRKTSQRGKQEVSERRGASETAPVLQS